MQALDKVYNAPQFNRKAFQKCCLNTAKTAKIGGNDYNCTANQEKLFLECERLADIAVQKSNMMNEMKEKIEQIEMKNNNQVDNGNSNKMLQQAQKDLETKEHSITYL